MEDQNKPPRLNRNNEAQGSDLEPKNEHPYYVVLPCEVKDFRSFVSGLLGKPQELRGDIEGFFKIGHHEIGTIYHLLEQRMKKQNDASLVHFVITVYYDDGQSVLHNTVEAFESFHPVTPCVPTGVVVSATYLIKFRGHNAPEKQEIEVTIATNPEYRTREIHRWFNSGLFEYRIVHTERTWATDIAGLLRNHAQTIIKPRSAVSKFVSRRADELTTYFALFVGLCTLLAWATTATGRVASFPGLQDLSAIKDLMSFAIRSVVASVAFVASVVAIKIYVENNAYISIESGIILTDHDKTKYAEKSKRMLFGWLKYCIAWIASLAMGVLSNKIYAQNWFW